MYALGSIGVMAGSYVAASGASALDGVMPTAVRRAGWWTHGLNLVPPFFAGAAIGLILARVLARRGEFGGTFRRHLSRTISWYLLAVGLGYVVYRNRDNADFGLWAQIVVWPLAGAVGALLTDVLLTWRYSTRGRRRANDVS